jgi:mannose-6-phosphate isomerase-like protein (cupin superfamily)
MRRPQIIFELLTGILCLGMVILMPEPIPALATNSLDDGYVIERDTEVAEDEPGPHSGTGTSTGYVFFEKVPGMKFSFRKRVLHKGASIGYHLQETDEVYYVTSGTGKMTINGKEFAVKAGDGILTQAGSSHGLMQTGAADLAIIITYMK